MNQRRQEDRKRGTRHNVNRGRMSVRPSHASEGLMWGVKGERISRALTFQILQLLLYYFTGIPFPEEAVQLALMLPNSRFVPSPRNCGRSLDLCGVASPAYTPRMKSRNKREMREG
jgi:hypothetical protein